MWPRQCRKESSAHPCVPLAHLKVEPSGQLRVSMPPGLFGESLQKSGELSVQPRVPLEHMKVVPSAHECMTGLPGCLAS